MLQAISQLRNMEILWQKVVHSIVKVHVRLKWSKKFQTKPPYLGILIHSASSKPSNVAVFSFSVAHHFTLRTGQKKKTEKKNTLKQCEKLNEIVNHVMQKNNPKRHVNRLNELSLWSLRSDDPFDFTEHYFYF